MTPTRYRDAGVDIDAGEEAVRRIKKTVQSTFGPHVVSEIGKFAGAVTVPGLDPEVLLLSSMDGVGTKLKVAAMMGKFDTVGEDLVNHCVGDIGVHGALPLFFLDYVGMGALDPAVVEAVVEGLARGCRANACALIGGETAEMPGVYHGSDFDLVGCIVGTVKRGEFVDGSGLAPGDALLGIPSTGLHTNGFSLARKVLFDDGGVEPSAALPGSDATVGQALLAVHRSYLPEIKALKTIMKGAAHITGGGLPGNVNRILTPGLSARIHRNRWTTLPIFRLIMEKGEVPEEEMFRAFNMGIGLVLAVPAERAEEALGLCKDAVRIGEIVEGNGSVTLEGETRW